MAGCSASAASWAESAPQLALISQSLGPLLLGITEGVAQTILRSLLSSASWGVLSAELAVNAEA